MITITFQRTAPPRAIKVRIIRVPAGSPPEEVRRAWLGLELPLHLPGTHQLKIPFFQRIARVRFTRPFGFRLEFPERKVGYLVAAAAAVDQLAQKHPHAARWFRENVPEQLAPGRLFLFALEECYVLETEKLPGE